MTRAVKLCGALALAALMITSFVGSNYRWHPPYGISQRSCDAIQPDMTRAEVEAIVGLPPGNYATLAQPSNLMLRFDMPFGVEETWEDNGGELQVWYNDHDLVSTCLYVPRPTILQRIRQLFRLP